MVGVFIWAVGMDIVARDRIKLAVERQRRICEMLSHKESITTTEICLALGVSPVTARSDLDALERDGKLTRVRGGATNVNQAAIIPSPDRRKSTNMEAKRVIAQLAAEQVRDGDSILLDSGTTTLELLRAISKKRDITIVTNDISIVELADVIMPNSAVLLLGGLYRHGHRLTYGNFVLTLLDKIYVDSAFMCPAGYRTGMGCMTETETSLLVKETFIQHARRNYLLMDTSKVGRGSFMSFATLADFSEAFLEKDPGEAFRREAAEYGCKVTFPQNA